MTLNDDVDEGLEQSLDGIVDAPDINPDSTTPPKVILANKTEAPTPEDNDINHVPVTRLFGSPIVPGELPNLDATFLITSEITNKANDVASVQSAIGSQCSVCQEDALAVDSVVPGFINSDRPLGYFTENKTKTQLTQTMASLDSAIDLHVVNLKDAATKITEKLVPAFREMSAKARESIQSSLVKYQFALGEIALAQANRSCSETARTLMTELDRNIPRHYDPDHEPSSFAGFQGFFKEITSVACSRDNRDNIANLCRRYREDVLIDAVMIGGAVYGITETEPYVTMADKQAIDSFDNSVSFSDVLHNGVDMVSITYLQGLINLSVSYTEAMARSAALMEQTVSKPDLTPKQRLDFLTQIVSINNTYAKQSVAIFGFVNDYFAVFDSIVGTVLDCTSKNKPIEVAVTPRVSEGT